ncbi:hypothetical protein HZS_653, partial [Henneguya salminicola]
MTIKSKKYSKTIHTIGHTGVTQEEIGSNAFFNKRDESLNKEEFENKNGYNMEVMIKKSTENIKEEEPIINTSESTSASMAHQMQILMEKYKKDVTSLFEHFTSEINTLKIKCIEEIDYLGAQFEIKNQKYSKITNGNISSSAIDPSAAVNIVSQTIENAQSVACVKTLPFRPVIKVSSKLQPPTMESKPIEPTTTAPEGGEDPKPLSPRDL